MGTVKIMLLGVALFRKERDERSDAPAGEKIVIRFPGDPGRAKHYDEHKVTHHHPWLYAKANGSGRPLRIPLAGTHASIEGATGRNPPPDAFPLLIPMEKVMDKPALTPSASCPSVNGPCQTMINLYEGQLQGGKKLKLTFPNQLKNGSKNMAVNGVWRTEWESFSPEVVVRIWTDANPTPAEIPLKAADWSEIYLVNADELTPEKSVQNLGCKKQGQKVTDNDFRWIYHLLSPGLPGSAEQAWKARLKKAKLTSLPCPEYMCPRRNAPAPAAPRNPEVGTCLQGSLDG